jgi:hypothetical protein
MSDGTVPKIRLAKLRRAAGWALLGGASGMVAWGIFFWSAGNTALLYAPGLLFGLFVGLALYRSGNARHWQAALFAALSVPAWVAGFFSGVEYGDFLAIEFFLDYIYLQLFVTGFIGGIAWSAVQTIAVLPFPFARQRRLLTILMAAGTVTPGLLLIVGTAWHSYDALLFTLWTSWYAVYAALLSTALPATPEYAAS